MEKYKIKLKKSVEKDILSLKFKNSGTPLDLFFTYNFSDTEKT